MLRIIAIVFAIALILPAQSARAEVSNCTNITSLPTVITVQGVYCLKQDLATSINHGNAITINTNNVTIDCNDWKIGGLAAGPGTDAYGIYAGNRKNITIRNCGIRGFRMGIRLDGSNSAYHFVEHNRIDLSTERGMLVYGDGATIRSNRVYDTGGRPNVETHGISAAGIGITTVDNTVAGVHANNHVPIGISSGPLVSSVGLNFVAHNRISGMSTSAPGYPIYGIYLWDGSMTHNNMVALQQAPANGFVGIRCGTSQALVKDNMVSGFTTPAIPVAAACTSSGNMTN